MSISDDVKVESDDVKVESATALDVDGKIDRTDHESGKTLMLKICEVLLLTPVMVVITGLFLFPTILYALPQAKVTVVDTQNTCTQVSEYSGEVCRDELMSLQMCFSGVTDPLSIPSSINQQTGESNAMSLVNGLSFLNPSQQCVEAITPFLCLSIFSLCDSNNTLHTILRQDCLDLRDDVCDSVWSQAVAFLGDGVLPVCEDLSDITVPCIDLDNSTTSTSDFASDQTTASASDFASDGTTASALDLETTAGSLDSSTIGIQVDQTSNNNSLECSDGFFFDENGTELCRPICGEFLRSPLGIQILLRASFAIGFIASFIMFIVGVVFQRDTMLAFPVILLFYFCIPFFVFTGLTLVGYAFNDLFCTSRDYLVVSQLRNKAPFCTIIGIGFIYFLEQICILAVLNSVFLYWSVAFPISYRLFKISPGRIRFTHIICVILTVVFPLPAALVQLKDGFIFLTYPATVCFGRDERYNFYTFILPISIALAMTSCLMVLSVWTIFKEFVLKKLLAKKKATNVGKAEIKIAAITIYVAIMGTVGLAGYTDIITNTYFSDVAELVICESTGRGDCQQILDSVPYLLITFFAMLPITSVVLLLISCSPQAFKMKYKAWKSNYLTVCIHSMTV